MIKLKGFSCQYGKIPVLEDLNLEIPDGKIIAIIGNNGSGKSTLAQVLSGLKLDFSGEVWLDDLKLKRRTSMREIRQKVSLVLQNPDNQIIFQKVSDDLVFVLDNLGVEKTRQEKLIQTALESVGMADFLQANPHELSGGQKQRIVIASAIITQPKYLILDEATSMLDPSGKRAIYNILQDFKKQEITTLFVTNWLEEIMIADEVMILDKRKAFLYERDELLKDLTIFTHHNLEIPLALKLLADKEEKVSC